MRNKVKVIFIFSILFIAIIIGFLYLNHLVNNKNINTIQKDVTSKDNSKELEENKTPTSNDYNIIEISKKGETIKTYIYK